MSGAIVFIVLLLMLATLAALVTGLVVMAMDGEINRKYGNRLMVARVAFQALTIAMLSMVVLFS